MPRAGDVPQKAQPLDVILGVTAVVGRRALRLNRVVALLPNANDMGTQAGQARGQLDWMMRFRHILNKIYTDRHLRKLTKKLITSICL